MYVYDYKKMIFFMNVDNVTYVNYYVLLQVLLVYISESILAEYADSLDTKHVYGFNLGAFVVSSTIKLFSGRDQVRMEVAFWSFRSLSSCILDAICYCS